MARTRVGPHKGKIAVPESVIQEFRDKGMAASLKKAESGKASKEFMEGIRRFYPSAHSEITKKAKNKKPEKSASPFKDAQQRVERQKAQRGKKAENRQERQRSRGQTVVGEMDKRTGGRRSPGDTIGPNNTRTAAETGTTSRSSSKGAAVGGGAVARRLDTTSRGRDAQGRFIPGGYKVPSTSSAGKAKSTPFKPSGPYIPKSQVNRVKPQKSVTGTPTTDPRSFNKPASKPKAPPRYKSKIEASNDSYVRKQGAKRKRRLNSKDTAARPWAN